MLGHNERALLPYIKQLANIETNNTDDNKESAHILNANIKNLTSKEPILNFNGVRKSNNAYIQAELEWYLSQNTNVDEISKTAKIWAKVCDKDGNVNSNYGYRIFSNECGEQYNNCLKELKNNIDTRRAIMQYTPTDIYTLAFENGRNDFICTNYTHCFIEKENDTHRLMYIIYQRSCDVIFGMFNDFAWHCYICEKLIYGLSTNYNMCESARIDWNIGTLHYYGRHTDVIKALSKIEV